MLTATRSAVFRPRKCNFVLNDLAAFTSCTRRYSQANRRLNLDPSTAELLRDAEISLKNKETSSPLHKELEIIPEVYEPGLQKFSEAEWTALEPPVEDGSYGLESKSPAAQFGSQQIGAVVLPLELQTAINLLIAETNKPRLHSDAMRLFQPTNADGESAGWDIQTEVKYHSRRQAERHETRDGTAFASIALPAHYSAIAAVFDHLKHRLGADWYPERIFDWGAGTGSGLWASLYSFQPPTIQITPDSSTDASIAQSSVRTYIGIDKRDGLVSIAKRLLSKISYSSSPQISWQRTFNKDDTISREDHGHSVALSAFLLSSLPDALAQKELVKELWSSGADTIVLIDHNSQAGFEAIARAREYLLKMGRLETEDPATESWPLRGSHVVAPCPHDRPCPLLETTGSLVCGFSQRFQRPSFVRLTKHSGVGHEDIEYSYVVVRHGPRPDPTNTSVGRIGAVGKRELLKQHAIRAPMKELSVHIEGTPQPLPELPPASDRLSEHSLEPTVDSAELEAQLRREAFQWPRLVFPPLKKSGHIILDACTPEGKIMRMTVPKSQGKQPFYDARKSSWGDIFPHPPKNPPLERYQPKSNKSGQAPKTGSDIGKRRSSHKNKERIGYTMMMKSLREEKKLSKREYARTRVDKAWQD